MPGQQCNNQEGLSNLMWKCTAIPHCTKLQLGWSVFCLHSATPQPWQVKSRGGATNSSKGIHVTDMVPHSVKSHVELQHLHPACQDACRNILAQQANTISQHHTCPANNVTAGRGSAISCEILLLFLTAQGVRNVFYLHRATKKPCQLKRRRSYKQ